MAGGWKQRWVVAAHLPLVTATAILLLITGCATVPTRSATGAATGAAAATGAGTGTPRDPYRISRFEELLLIGQEEVGYSLDAHYLLVQDIDASPTMEDGWQPIGAFTFDESGSPQRAGHGARINGGFTGGIDGGGHTIRNLTLHPAAAYGGFISGLVGAYIRNVRFENLRVLSAHPVGGVVGYNSGLIDNVSVSGVVAGGTSVGGITAINEGQIRDSSFEGEVSGVRYVAGIAAFNELGNIIDTTARVHVHAQADAAAFVVVNSAEIRGSQARGTVISGERAAAFVLENYGVIYEVASRVDVDSGNANE